MTWTRITDPEQAVGPVPVWFGTRMIGLRGRFGLVLLTTGDILRITAYRAKTAMLEIAQLYENLAEQKRRLEQLGLTSREIEKGSVTWRRSTI
jgi:hypothetical protein